jgi:serine/threonine protein kinase
MEYVQGRTFHQFVPEKPSLSVRKRVAEELMEALETLHAHQIVHGDLKQDNILITDVGNHVRLIDFGFSDTDAYIAKIAIAQDNEAYTRMVEHLFPGRLNYLVRLAVLRRWRLTWLVPLIMIACMVAAAIIYMRPVYKGIADVQPATIADTTQRDVQTDTVVVTQRVVRRDTVVVTQQVVRRDTVMVSAPEDETWTGIKKELDVSCKSLYDLYADSITKMPEKEYDKAFELHHAYAMRMFDLKQQLSADYPQYEEQIEEEHTKLYGIGYSKLSQIFRYYPYVIRN